MSLKSIVLLVFQFLSMGFLLKGYTFDKSIVGIGVQLIGVTVAVAGILAGGINAFNMHPEVKSEKLITTGIYKWIRNPMYLGLIIFFLADLLTRSTFTRWAAYIVLVITLFFKISSEERFLSMKFGDDFSRYKSSTKRLIPFVY